MEIKDLYKEWIKSPLRFVKEVIQAEPTPQQEQALVALGNLVTAKIRLSRQEVLPKEELTLAKKMGISIQSGHGTGKDAFCAWAICWFLCCFPYSKIPCTAPTSDQLDSILWSEIVKWAKNSKKDEDGFSILNKWLVIQNKKILFLEGEGKEWFAIARTSNPKSNTEEQAETLAGFHEDYLMIVIDEASGVPEPVFRPLEGGLTGKVNFMLLVFNPTRNKGFAINSQQGNRSDWICFRWNSEDSPIVEKTFIDRMAKKYGKDSNPYRIRVLGLPPVSTEDTLIPWEWIQDAVDREIVSADDDPIIFGVDAGAGGDHSSIIRRQGGKILEIKRINTKQTMELTGSVSQELVLFEDYRGCCVDNIGIGLGVYNRLQELEHKRIFAADVRRSPRDAQRFCRLRDELWWKLRTMFEEGTISIPNDDELIAQLSVIKWRTESDGKIKIESKEDMVKRGIASPNDADALMLSMYLSDAAFRVPNYKKDYWEDFPKKSKRKYEGVNSWMAA